jgi:hypothetical protein
MIPATELTAMQAEIVRLLPDTCSILSVTHTDDGAGGWTDTFGTVTGVACRLDHLTGREAIAAGAVQPFGRYMLTIASSGTIVPANQVVHGGLTYNVMDVNIDTSWMGCKRAVVEVVR